MSFWGDIEHIVKKAALLDPTVLTVTLFEKEFRKKHGRKPNANERSQWESVKAKHGVAGLGDAQSDAAQQAQDQLTALNPLAPGAAHDAQQKLIAQATDADRAASRKGWLFVAAMAFLIWRGKLT